MTDRSVAEAWWNDLSEWHESTVGQFLLESSARHPDRLALQWPGHRGLEALSWSEVLAQASAGAAHLRERGDNRPVAVLGPNSPGWYIAFWSVALSGRPLAPLNPGLTDSEIVWQVADCGASVVLAARDHRGRDLVEAMIDRCHPPEFDLEVWDLDHWIPQRDLAVATGSPDPSDPIDTATPTGIFMIQYTSGTTGLPKGAVLSHRACVNSASTVTAMFEPSEHEIWCSPMPLHHVGASVAHAIALASIAGTYVMLSRFSPTLMMESAGLSRATLLAGVPTVYLGILDDPELAEHELPDLRVMMLGGASIPPSLVTRMEAHFGARVAVLYGQSEAPAITQTRLDDDAIVKANTLGRPLPHRELRIVDLDNGIEVPTGSVGEICVRTEVSMDHYLNRPDATAAAIDGQRWLHTGDLGAVDAEGLLTFHGRVREVIIRGGENIYSREIENAISSFPGVLQVAVVGLPDDRWGEIVAAVVVPVTGTTLSASVLSEQATKDLAYFKRPERWYVVDDLPMTASGKIQKFKIVANIGAPEMGSLS